MSAFFLLVFFLTKPQWNQSQKSKEICRNSQWWHIFCYHCKVSNHFGSCTIRFWFTPLLALASSIILFLGPLARKKTFVSDSISHDFLSRHAIFKVSNHIQKVVYGAFVWKKHCFISHIGLCAKMHSISERRLQHLKI